MFKCLFKEPCEFKTEDTKECLFEGRCNQQAQLYVINGKEIWLRHMNGNKYILTMLNKEQREQIGEPKE